MRIVLTGGGTGGHVLPNVAVIEELRKRSELELFYIGSKNGVEKKIIEKLGIRYEGVHCGKLRRYFSWENFKDFFKLPMGIVGAYTKLRKFKADVVFSKGGYVALPVILAAAKLHIPTIVHESDLIPGLANKISFRFAEKICLSFEESKSYLKKEYVEKAVVTGNPVRSWILEGDKEAGLKFSGFDTHRPVLLVMGGSQGAMQINNLLRDSMDSLLKKFQIVHIVGKGNLDIGLHKKGYTQYEFLDKEMKDIYAMADLVVSRAGANSLAELALLKKRAVIIPLSYASRGDQLENAKIFGRDMGWSILGGDFGKDDFVKAIEMAMINDFNPSAKFKNGSKEIVKIILNLGE